MDEPWVLVISAAVGAGVGVLGNNSCNLFLVGQRRAEATHQIVRAQRIVIEDLRDAYEKMLQRPALSKLSKWSDCQSE